MDDLLTVKQAAVLLKVHPLTVRRYINEGKFKAVKLAGNIRISHEEIRNSSEVYAPRLRVSKTATFSTTSVFQPNDPIFRLKGRGMSIEYLENTGRRQ